MRALSPSGSWEGRETAQGKTSVASLEILRGCRISLRRFPGFFYFLRSRRSKNYFLTILSNFQTNLGLFSSVHYHSLIAAVMHLRSPLFALESRRSARLLSGFLLLSYYTALSPPSKTEAMRIARSCVCKSAPVCCCLSRLAKSISSNSLKSAWSLVALTDERACEMERRRVRKWVERGNR